MCNCFFMLMKHTRKQRKCFSTNWHVLILPTVILLAMLGCLETYLWLHNHHQNCVLYIIVSANVSASSTCVPNPVDMNILSSVRDVYVSHQLQYISKNLITFSKCSVIWHIASVLLLDIISLKKGTELKTNGNASKYSNEN